MIGTFFDADVFSLIIVPTTHEPNISRYKLEDLMFL